MAAPALARAAMKHVTLRRPPLLVNNGAAVPEHVAAEGLEASLALIEPVQLRFGHGPQAHQSSSGARALFRWGGEGRNFPITDLLIGPRLVQHPPGLYTPAELGLPESELLLTVSLSLPHEQWCYKLVAAVVPLPQG